MIYPWNLKKTIKKLSLIPSIIIIAGQVQVRTVHVCPCLVIVYCDVHTCSLLWPICSILWPTCSILWPYLVMGMCGLFGKHTISPYNRLFIIVLPWICSGDDAIIQHVSVIIIIFIAGELSAQNLQRLCNHILWKYLTMLISFKATFSVRCKIFLNFSQ